MNICYSGWFYLCWGGITLRKKNKKKIKPACRPGCDEVGYCQYTHPLNLRFFSVTHLLENDITGKDGPDNAPKDARAYYLEGLSHEKEGNYARAIQDYDRAIGLDPRLAWAYYRRGIAYGNKGNLRRQIKDLEVAAELGLGMAVDMLAVCEKPDKGMKRDTRDK